MVAFDALSHPMTAVRGLLVRIGRLAHGLSSRASLVRFRMWGRMPLVVAALVCGSLGPASPASASADDDFLEVQNLDLRTSSGEPSFNQGRPFAISINRSMAAGRAVRSHVMESLRRAGMLDKVVFDPFSGLTPGRLEVNIGSAVPIEISTAILDALVTVGVSEPVALSSMNSGSLGKTHRVYVGSLAPTSHATVTMEELQRLRASPELLHEYLASTPPRLVRGPAELPTLVGTFVTELTPGAGGLELSCASDARCTMRLLSAKDRATVLETHQFESVTKLRDASMVSYALKYTQDKLARPSPNSDPDLLAARQILAPLQGVNLGSDDCHDLGSREGDAYLVVCRVQQSPWKRPTLLFFASELSGCGALSCRYRILPMFAVPRGGPAK